MKIDVTCNICGKNFTDESFVDLREEVRDHIETHRRAGELTYNPASERDSEQEIDDGEEASS